MGPFVHFLARLHLSEFCLFSLTHLKGQLGNHYFMFFFCPTEFNLVIFICFHQNLQGEWRTLQVLKSLILLPVHTI